MPYNTLKRYKPEIQGLHDDTKKNKNKTKY